MHRQQVVALCGCNLAIYSGISGAIGLMPVYLAQLGAGSGLTGIFLAFAYLSLAIGTILGGRLADRVRRRPLLILGGALAVPATWLMSTVTIMVPLMLLLGCLWFVTGITLTMVNTLAGLGAPGKDRGGTFGVLSLSASLGLLLGSLGSGYIADRWGYPALFVALAVHYLLVPFAGLFVRERSRARTPDDAAPGAVRCILGNRTFLFLFIGSIAAQAANSVIFLSRALIMHALHFDAAAITTAAAVGQLVTLPLPLIIGRLSDRLGRAPLLIACFLTTAPALLVLALAVNAWQFWVASALQTVLGASTAVGSALMADIFPEEILGTALALLNATPWIGIVLGLSGAGVAISVLHMMPTLLLSALLSLVATLVLLPISTPEHRSSFPGQQGTSPLSR